MPDQTSVADQVNGQTIVTLLRRNAQQFAGLPAMTSLDAAGEPTLAWGEVRHEVAVLARGLGDLGLQRGERMLIMAPSSPEHLLVDLAAVHVAAIPCTAYATLSPDQIRYVARHSAASVVVLQGMDELKRWEQVLGDLPKLRQVVMIESKAVPADDARFSSLDDVRRRGTELHEADPSVFEHMSDSIKPSDPLSMIYTSGTTGDPKGVVLTHANAVYESYAVQARHHMPLHVANIAYLPLAHIAERELAIYLPITLAGHVHTLADPTAVMSALGRVHPQGFFGVPRVWEKMVAGLKNMLANAPEDRRAALTQANELLQQGYKLRDAGEPVPPELAEKIAEADRTVLAPVRQLLGMDRLVFCSSGAAPLPVEVLYFLAGLGVEIHEVWGLSETTGAVTANSAEAFRAGTVGRPLADTEVKVAEDGELLVRGPLVFPGYLREDGTIEPAVDDEGWYATGDIGQIDADGFVKITDRKKELIITSGGKNIAPTRIEGLLKEHPLISQAVAIGNDRPYVTALIVLDDEILPGWATAQGIEFTDVPTLAAHPLVCAEIQRAVESANGRLARAEQIKRYELITKPWTPESGEVTPTLKLKRRVINDRYVNRIAALYS
ncbi:AMP-dependent synthetase/ligase [Amycolatopsis pithecellobii]|uniref:Acyl-CoA synthetase n=1 Tax=Amycolatopsis pithecellobii TaxID=664692 RepID=A0A6N7Z9J7_9PSEU|nr:AMP-dependent synthetase/ligase [Amycolatopsis pithecellobii]MTD58402.1 AMP-binding protein [Amycolatopsis pithecellobii]